MDRWKLCYSLHNNAKKLRCQFVGMGKGGGELVCKQELLQRDVVNIGLNNKVHYNMTKCTENKGRGSSV